MSIKLGVLLWSQGSDWARFEEAARRVDELGYDHLWTWDHLYAIFGNPYQDIFEGWMALAAWAKVTSRIRLGLLVGANSFRHPGLVAKLVTTLDHQSEGRAILGLGGAWFELEHEAFGIEFGRSPGERLGWLDEAAGLITRLLAGEVVSHHGERYHAEELRIVPGPVAGRRLPLMIGGGGEQKTLRTVARYADMWNAFGDIPTLERKIGVLRRHCEEVGRDFTEIDCTVGCKPVIRDTEDEARRVFEALMEANQTPRSRVEGDQSFWIGTPAQIAERIIGYRELGFATIISEIPAPYDQETLERLVGEVKPLVDAG
ncbi:MAG TPA: LLM class flavin-dependent oxidoreductase [Acidimicrobiia bacterium]|nr:LLM class flavin-dependent oxidoreductase [Acidimicrobiia bacterium]